MNTEMLSPELQLNNMLEQINAQLPNNKAQKVSEIMNSVLGGEMLLRHVGFYKALGGLGDKIKQTYNDISSGESGVVDSVINNVVPESLQPLARGAATALQGGGTAELEAAARTAAAPLVQAAGDAVPEALQPAARGLVTALQGGGTAELEAAARTAAAPLVQSAGGAVPEALQPAARAAATALTGGGTQELESVAREAINPIVERSVAPLIQEVEQAPGFLDRMVSGLRDLGGRVSNTFRARAPAQVDDPYDLDDPAMNLRMDDPFSEGPLNIDLASRRGLFRLAPEVGEQDSGQNIGNAFSQARAQGELPDLPIFDGMREVPQSSTIQEQQAAANRAFTSDEPAAQQEPPAAQQEQEPATQETEQISGEESIPATVSEEGGIVSEVAPEVAAATGGTSVIAPTIAKVSGEVAEGGGFEFGPLLEGAAILGAVVPQLVSLFEKPESITASYVGDQIGL